MIFVTVPGFLVFGFFVTVPRCREFRLTLATMIDDGTISINPKSYPGQLWRIP